MLGDAEEIHPIAECIQLIATFETAHPEGLKRI
jgi:hypothetical protein